MSKLVNIDLVKQEYLNSVFGSLTVIDAIRYNNVPSFVCKCTCGKIVTLPINRVLHLRVKSCGCRSSIVPRINIDDLKSKYIGKQINWFTIEDIFRNDKNIIIFKCKCKCGNTRDITKKLLFSKHSPISCGCYKRSQENKDRIKQRYIDNPELKQIISDYKKQWYKDNPDKAIKAAKKCSEFYNKNPEKRKEVGAHISAWFKDNKIAVNKWIDHRRKYYKEHPEIGIARSELYKNNPKIKEKISNSNKEYSKNHPEKIAEIAEKNRSIALYKRSKRDYSKLFCFVHEDYIDDLINGKIKSGDIIKTKCPVCNKYADHRFNISIKNGDPPLCKECHVNLTSCYTSKYEDEIACYINALCNDKCVRNDRSILNGKELDLYYPDKNIAIEFNGFYWHDENHKPKDYHFNKFKLCKEKGIQLISIFEQDWLYKHEKIINLLNDLFSNKFKLYARKCEIKKVDLNTKSEFINKYHFDSDSNQGTIAYGLYYNNELLSVMTFGKLRGQNSLRNNEDYYELVRFVTKSCYKIIGGASKLLNHFIKDYNPKYIMCYSDNDFFTGKTYCQLGFNLKSLGEKSLDYQWVSTNKCLSRQQCMPFKLLKKYPEYNNIEIKGSKEKYIMEDLGYCRVYRCGNSKWELLIE